MGQRVSRRVLSLESGVEYCIKRAQISISELGLIMRSLGRAPTELEVKDYMKSIDKGSGSFDIAGLLDVRRRAPCFSLHYSRLIVCV